MDRALTLGGYGHGDGQIEEAARKTYARLWGRFDAWCRSHGRRPIPASSEALAQFCQWFVQERGYSTATAEVACTAVRWRHRVAGETPPDRVAAWYVLRELHATGGSPEGEERPFRAACRDDLATVAEACDLGTAAGVRDLLAVVLPYALGVGDVELAALQLEDVHFASTFPVRVYLEAPARVTGRLWFPPGWGEQALPCDGFGQRPWHPDGVSNLAGARYGCPACTLKLWRLRLADQGAVADQPGRRHRALLRPVDARGNIAGSPAHAGAVSISMGGGFRPVVVRKLIGTVMRRADLDDAVRRRPVTSLRIGAALEARDAGAVHAEVAARAGFPPTSLRLARYLALPGIDAEQS